MPVRFIVCIGINHHNLPNTQISQLLNNVAPAAAGTHGTHAAPSTGPAAFHGSTRMCTAALVQPSPLFPRCTPIYVG